MSGNSAANARIMATVYGRVQGVGYRAFAREAALQLGLSGYVRNLSDGSVQVVAEGEKQLLDRFIEKLKEGPPFGRVTDAEVTWHEYIGDLKGFSIRP